MIKNKQNKKLSLREIKIEEHRQVVNRYRLVQRLIFLSLKKGKLNKVSNILEKLYLFLLTKKKENPSHILIEAINNVQPFFLLQKKRIGRRSIIQPRFIVSSSLREFLAIKWLIESTKTKKKGNQKNFYTSFGLEILEAFDGRGITKRRQEEVGSIVLSNKSNIKYRWEEELFK